VSVCPSVLIKNNYFFSFSFFVRFRTIVLGCPSVRLSVRPDKKQLFFSFSFFVRFRSIVLGCPSVRKKLFFLFFFEV